ncbi:MAG: Rieske (2Fe-2S) protein [Acidobacteria bacterium]|nr:Rieske (2Fe-2S) protein [Acidobacteriota bacterium]
MSDFISVAKLTDVPSGEGRVVEAGGVAIALFNVDGTFHALDNTCLHRGGPLGDGVCADGTVTCPWHGWQYDMATGECKSMPGESVDTYEVRVEGEDVQVKL